MLSASGSTGVGEGPGGSGEGPGGIGPEPTVTLMTSRGCSLPALIDVYNKLIVHQKSDAKLSRDDVDMLIHLVDGAPYLENLNRLEAVPRLIEVFGLIKNKPLVDYFMRNGFEKLKSKSGRWVPTLDVEGLIFE